MDGPQLPQTSPRKNENTSISSGAKKIELLNSTFFGIREGEVNGGEGEVVEREGEMVGVGRFRSKVKVVEQRKEV